MTATLEQLVKVHSQLVEEVLSYLAQLASRLDQTDWWRGSEQIKASEIAVEPFVLTMRRRERQSRQGPEREGPEVLVEKQSPMDEIEAERYELPVNVEEREEERWRQVIQRGRVRLGLKGAPGSGKTFTTRQTVVSLAREAAAQLKTQQAGVEDVEIPIWVTAKALAQSGAREIEDALLEAMENGWSLKPSPNLRSWLKHAISSSRSFIVVDALDELVESDRSPFEAKAKQLEGLSARVIATCRTMQWEERKSWLGWSSLTEVELAPFKRRQQREFTGKFFESKADFAQNMERLLQINFALRHACTTPLLLTFACLLHEEGKVDQSTSYASLYAQMGRWMISGRWRGFKPSWAGSRVREESCWLFFEDLAWGLFSKAPHLNRFTLEDWRQAAKEAVERGAVAPMDSTVFLDELERVGFIVPAGFDEQRDDACWSFVHRTFLEFLAARALSRMDSQVWLAEAKQHFWFAPEWLEVLTFLAGLVDDATPLIEAVGEEQKNDDLFGSMLYLKARLVGAARRVDEQVAKQVGNEVLSFWRGTFGGGYCLRDFAAPKLMALALNEKAQVVAIKGVLELTRSEHGDVRSAAADALGQIGDPQTVNRLLDLIVDKEGYVCHAAGDALGQIGDPQTVNRLLELTRDKNVRQAVVEALGHIGGPQAVNRLLELTQDEFWVVRRDATSALCQIAHPQTVNRLLELTRDEEWPVRQPAARALGQIGDPQAVNRLLEMTRDKDWGVRRAAARALGQIGDLQIVNRLLEWAWDEEWRVRDGAACALGQIGGLQAVNRLLELTQDEVLVVRQAAVEALGQIGDPQAVNRLLELTRDEHWPERWPAARALGQIGGLQAVNRLLELTQDEVWDVRQAAVEALGQIGDPQAVNRLLELTWDEHMSKDAADVLGQIGDPQAVNRLLELTRERHIHVGRAAARALWQITWKNKVKVRMQSHQ